jgi:hypothetical protein
MDHWPYPQLDCGNGLTSHDCEPVSTASGPVVGCCMRMQCAQLQVAAASILPWEEGCAHLLVYDVKRGHGNLKRFV